MTPQEIDRILATANCTPEERDEIKFAYAAAHQHMALSFGRIPATPDNISQLSKALIVYNERYIKNFERKEREKASRN